MLFHQNITCFWKLPWKFYYLTKIPEITKNNNYLIKEDYTIFPWIKICTKCILKKIITMFLTLKKY